MDRIDRKILTELQQDCRISISALSDKVGLSSSACHRRVKLLETGGQISGYVARLDPKALGYTIEIFVEITLNSQSEDALEMFEAAVMQTSEISECHLMAGQADYLLRVMAKNVADYEQIHRAALSRLPGVAHMQSTFTLRTVRPWKGYPVS
ncbi:Lrp/AsnC family transcriptional regulator [Motiliproteus sp. MSK22-1]|uniref:Lrp/AsnC family transcriptional regulator n=1 Tax=Motiliproteus sp. MSK22-1 TaxID=1897630 RepID=UPI000977CB0E|nr:Lrp/AsnC family transcriptional regulator [Motiliproteus sp. MSK22-1]OMH25548.1 AsnC family transcriptional regulator [Motiliproteus sp. MSK22-1]